MFVVKLQYIVPLEKIDELRAEHILFLDKYYAAGVFLFSGAQVPRTGGVIIVRGCTKEEIEEILSQDPFAINKCATYEITEFNPSKHAEGLNTYL